MNAQLFTDAMSELNDKYVMEAVSYQRKSKPQFNTWLSKVACVFLAVLLTGSAVLTFSVEARAAFFGWVREQIENYYEYFFEGEVFVNDLKEYELGWLPENLELIYSGDTAGGKVYMAYICWYAKGEGIIAIFISSMIMGVLLAQAFNLNFTQGFYMYHFLEVITWLIGVILLRKKPKEYVIEIGLSVVIAFIYQLVMPHWG